MVLGGGGSPTPKAEIIVQLGFVAAVLAWTWWAGRSANVPRPLLFFGAALVALPLIQLLPLPPVIWQALPGRELQLANLALVEIENRAGVTRLVLSQPIVLEAGEYRVFGSVAGANADRVLISVTCSVPGRPRGGGGALGRGQLVRAPDCPDQVMGIWLRPGSGALRLDDMRMERVGD